MEFPIENEPIGVSSFFCLSPPISISFTSVDLHGISNPIDKPAWRAIDSNDQFCACEMSNWSSEYDCFHSKPN